VRLCVSGRVWQLAKWGSVASTIDPDKAYINMDANWGIVAAAGEAARWTLGPAFGGNLSWVEGVMQREVLWTGLGQPRFPTPLRWPAAAAVRLWGANAPSPCVYTW
jgi:hypothetical protein